MKQVNPNRLRNHLNTVVNDVEQILHTMSDASGDRIGVLKSRAESRFFGARARLADAERLTAAQLRRATRQAKGYARHHPWKALGGIAAITVAVAMLSRTRH